ncbi:MAG: HEPN domain-containing protein [Bacteroidales bacterium]|jgi:uncharacterized protein (UPF0332 family)|nr:HEPN domain-containing protein [Bacteroidales bacterium]
MRPSKEEKDAIAVFRLQKAHETLNEAKGIAKMNYWHAAANRLYYACFYAVSGLLIKHGYSARTHGGVFSLFGLHFVTTRIISNEQNKLFRKLYDIRQSGDYEDMSCVDEEDIMPLLEPAENFIKTIEQLILMT